MKVIWLCHFANSEIKAHFKNSDVQEFAPWINNLIKLFKNNRFINLHIIAPNVFNNKNVSFIIDEITYHFYQHRVFQLKELLNRKFFFLLRMSYVHNNNFAQKKIVSLVDKIKPDLIHLHGAENPYYSEGIIPLFGKYPVLTSIQGFIRHTSINSNFINQRIKVEESIIKKCDHFGVRTDYMCKIIGQINPKAILHYHNYPIQIPTKIKNNIGAYEPIDCLYFAKLSKDKGVEDFLEAVSIVKKSMPNITAAVIGTTGEKYFNYLKDYCVKLGINNNVKFLGFMPTQIEVFNYAFNSKICVLPSYHDIIPGTIIESMFLKLPIVAYSVGGIPELNREEELILLAEKNNTLQLSEKIIFLLENVRVRTEIAEKAYKYVNKRYDNNNVIKDIINAYNSIIS